MRRDARRLFECSKAALAAVEQENTCCTVKSWRFSLSLPLIAVTLYHQSLLGLLLILNVK